MYQGAQFRTVLNVLFDVSILILPPTCQILHFLPACKALSLCLVGFELHDQENEEDYEEVDVCRACTESGCTIKMTSYRGNYATWLESSKDRAPPPNLVVVCFAGIGGVDGGEEVEMEMDRVKETGVPWCLLAGTKVEMEVYSDGSPHTLFAWTAWRSVL